MDELAAVEIFKDAYSVFMENGVKIWLDSGTLLGAARDGKFIPWDNDIDLAVWKECLDELDKRKILMEIENKGYQAYFLQDKLVIEKDSVQVNISIFMEKHDVALRELIIAPYWHQKPIKALWWALSVDCYTNMNIRHLLSFNTLIKHVLLFVIKLLPKKDFCRNKVQLIAKKLGCKHIFWQVPKQYFYKLQVMPFYGVNCYVPEDINGYLTFRYGPKWNEPIREWSTVASDGAVKHVN